MVMREVILVLMALVFLARAPLLAAMEEGGVKEVVL
jgi:hypothetical protein